MTRTKLAKKLHLATETLRTLDADQLDHANGGGAIGDITSRVMCWTMLCTRIGCPPTQQGQ